MIPLKVNVEPSQKAANLMLLENLMPSMLVEWKSPIEKVRYVLINKNITYLSSMLKNAKLMIKLNV